LDKLVLKPSIKSKIRASHCVKQQQSSPFNAPSPGKEFDKDRWVHCISKSLQTLYGTSLFDELGLADFEQVHCNQRHVVISHGTQDDPIFNYANEAGLKFFDYSEEEFVQLQSKYSTPDGFLRADRTVIVERVRDQGWVIIDKAVRQNKSGDCFLVHRILFFNVFDDDGKRIGQAATFDRERVVALTGDAVGGIDE
jgi:hypothetical protein